MQASALFGTPSSTHRIVKSVRPEGMSGATPILQLARHHCCGLVVCCSNAELLPVQFCVIGALGVRYFIPCRRPSPQLHSVIQAALICPVKPELTELWGKPLAMQ
jgi:hypothetical protein